MKKFFFFAAALVAAVSMSAAEYSFAGIQAGDITTAGEVTTTTMDSKEVPAVKALATTEIATSFKQIPNLVLNYKRSDDKIILKCAEDYLQVDGNKMTITLTNVTPGETITLTVSAKGSTNAVFEAKSGCVASPTNPASVAKAADLASYDVISFIASASTVEIYESAGGYRISKIAFGSAQAVENTVEAVKATKVIENGQLVIIKNGVRYDAAGAKL